MKARPCQIIWDCFSCSQFNDKQKCSQSSFNTSHFLRNVHYLSWSNFSLCSYMISHELFSDTYHIIILSAWFCSTTWGTLVPHLSYSSIFFISFFIKNGLSIRRKISNGLTWLNMNLTHSTQFLQSHNTDDFLFFYGLSQHTGKCLFLDAYRVLKYQFPAIKY